MPRAETSGPVWPCLSKVCVWGGTAMARSKVLAEAAALSWAWSMRLSDAAVHSQSTSGS
jgi:hypothetical protein